MNRPWMPLYIADYLKDTTHLGAIESGAYLHLIMDYWQNGKLPSDDRQLARIAKLTDREWKRCRPVLQAFFNDGWRHKRIDKELAHAADVVSKRAAAAAAKWAAKAAQTASNGDANASANASANDHANAYTLHTTERKKERDPADAGSSSESSYAFESGVIRLKQEDFDRWRKHFSYLDLGAELLGLTEWAGQQAKWFPAVSGALAKRNREAKTATDKQKSTPFKYMSGIEGVV